MPTYSEWERNGEHFITKNKKKNTQINYEFSVIGECTTPAERITKQRSLIRNWTDVIRIRRTLFRRASELRKKPGALTIEESLELEGENFLILF